MSRPFQCQNCDKSYNTKRELVNHEKRIHLGRFDFLCELCSKSFVDQLSLKRHKANIHEPLKYKCHICQKSRFGQRSHLNEHLSQVHGCVRVTCEYCKKVLRDIKSKNQHVLSMHHRENCSFQCGFCSKKFCNESLLKRHEKKKHKREYYLFDKLDNETISENVTTLTYKSCTTTNSIFANDSVFNQDDDDFVENNVEQTLLAEIEDGPSMIFTCSTCNKDFANDKELRRHVRKCHYGSETRMKNFKCDLCPKHYSSRESLRRHIREFHENQAVKTHLDQKYIFWL